jgi:hypothetical protein
MNLILNLILLANIPKVNASQGGDFHIMSLKDVPHMGGSVS